MSSLNLVSARLAGAPATGALYEYIVAGNGLFVCAECLHLAALLPVAPAACCGLAPLEPAVSLQVERIPAAYLQSIYQSALSKLPLEAAYQFTYDPRDRMLPWTCRRPDHLATPASVDYRDDPEAVVDLHSHGALPAFWSATDDKDEGGLRFYCVIGDIGTNLPSLRCRVGVYGHHWDIPARTLFEGLGPFHDFYGVETSDEAASE